MTTDVELNQEAEVDQDTGTTPEATPAAEPAAASETPAEGSAVAAPEGEKPAEEAAPKSALEAVMRVHEQQRKAAEEAAKGVVEKEPTPEVEKEVEAQAADEDLTEGKISDEVWRKMHPVERKRVTQFRAKVKAIQEEVAALMPRAQNYDALRSWVDQSGLSQEQFTKALEIAASAVKDPAKAFEELQPVIERLREQLGMKLPQELVQAVENGEVSEQHAVELARTRADKARLQAALERQQETETQGRLTEQAQAVRAKVVDAVRGWEAQWKASDPDYQKKATLVQDRIHLVMEQHLRDGAQIDSALALKVAGEARKYVEQQLSSFVPKPQAKTPVSAGGATTNHNAQPASALEAMKLAAQKMGMDVR